MFQKIDVVYWELGLVHPGMQEDAKRVGKFNHDGVLSVDCVNLVLTVLTKTLQ